MKNIKTKFTIIGLILVFLVTSGASCGVGGGDKKEASKAITLDYWRVWDGKDTFDDIINSYKTIHPNVTIKYKKLRYEEYEKELLDAFAEGRAPDIVSLHSSWLRRYQQKLEPLPPSITMGYPVVKGTLKKETVIETRTNKSITPTQIKQDFLDVVYDNAIVDGEIYGLPLSVDSLVLFYNRDLLNVAGITEAPRYWDETFLKNVKAMTTEDNDGNLVQSGVALGTSANVQRYSDILTLLMMQNGAEMLDEKGNVAFHQKPRMSNKDYAPGLDALRFYTDFANPLKEVYNWNDSMPDSLSAFVEGRVAMFFGYAYHLPQIKAQAPRLNFGISPMLQVEGGRNINFANLWVESVSKQSANTDVAWDFIQFATQAEQAKKFLAKANKPTALRALVNSQKEDEGLAVFAEQLLTSINWYNGNDYNAAEIIIGEMIEQALLDPAKIDKAISLGAKKVQQTIK
ncbi:MAG: extracellular solute-binding protein [Candidatus Falkowbacteria bacterium]